MRRLSTLALLLIGYVVAAKIGLFFASVHLSATAIWPPTGIALAAFLLLGRDAWPAIFAGAFLANAITEGSFAGHECFEVHAAWRHDRCDRRRRARVGDASRRGHRDRHRTGAVAADLRPLHAGRSRSRSLAGGTRHRLDACETLGRIARGDRRGR